METTKEYDAEVERAPEPETTIEEGVDEEPRTKTTERTEEREPRPPGWAVRFACRFDGDPAPNVEGLCLKGFDPEADDGEGRLDTTVNPRFARIFSTPVEAASYVYGSTSLLATFGFDFVFVAKPAEQAPGYGAAEAEPAG